MYVKQKSPLYVMLSGANSKGIYTRWSYYKFCKGSILCIADPMLQVYENLALGWYYGSPDCNFRKIISDFVREIAKKLKVKNEDIFFIGSSGGGAVTFECASYIPNAKAIAINPQIVLKEYTYAKEFSKITGNDLSYDPIGHRNNALYYLQHCVDNQHLIIMNIRSQKDMKQLDNIRNALHINIQYGLNAYENLLIWLYDADTAPIFSPHAAVENYCIWFFIEYIMHHINDREFSSNVRALYRVVNEFWYEHWRLKKQQMEKMRQCFCLLKNMNNKGKELAVFGGGNIARQLLRDVLDVRGMNYFHIRYIIDNDISKRGEIILGCTIKHPSEIKNWEKLYVIIGTDLYSEQIRKQLETFGLVYQDDFMYGMDLL